MIRVLHMLPDFQLGGGQVLVLRNAMGLDPGSFRSFVCSVWRDLPGSITHRFVDAGIPVFNLELRRSRLPWVAQKLLRYVRENRIDLIHTNNTHWDRRFGVFAGWALGIPVINSYHSMLFGRRTALEEGFDAWLCTGRLDRVIAVSEAVREAWHDHLRSLKVPEDRIHVVFTGVDTDRYALERSDAAPLRLAQELGLQDRGPVLLDVARLDPGKGQHRLIPLMRSVLERFPRAVLLLAGDGPMHAELEAAIGANGLEESVRLLGSRDDVPELLALSDLFVFPSIGEGFGLAVLEAMAAGKPTVAFDLPALREIVEDGVTSTLVPLEDDAALGRAVLDALESPERRREMGERARSRARARFSRAASIRALEGVYRSALGLERLPGGEDEALRKVAG